MQALVTPVLEALGEETDKSPVWRTDFRTKTRHLLCETGHPACVEHAQTHYARWLQSPTPDSGMPSVFNPTSLYILVSSFVTHFVAFRTVHNLEFPSVVHSGVAIEH